MDLSKIHNYKINMRKLKDDGEKRRDRPSLNNSAIKFGGRSVRLLVLGLVPEQEK